MEIILERSPEQAAPKVQTLGQAYVLDASGHSVYSFKTMELGWNDNKARQSCIPTGVYKVVKRNSPKYGAHFHVLDVTNRSYILIHAANYSRQLLGCIAPGISHIDIDKDGLKDVTSSKAVMSRLNELMPNEFYMTIV